MPKRLPVALMCSRVRVMIKKNKADAYTIAAARTERTSKKDGNHIQEPEDNFVTAFTKRIRAMFPDDWVPVYVFSIEFLIDVDEHWNKHDPDMSEEDSEDRRRAILDLRDAVSSLHSLLENLPDIEQRSVIARAANKMFWGAIMFGKFAGGIPAFRAKAIKRENQVKAGEASGISRRKEAATTWQPHALELALDCRQKSPSASQDAVASYINKNWRLNGLKCPSHSSLKNFVSECIKKNRLPPKVS